MKTNEKSIPVLLVSSYEMIRTGILAVLLKMEPGIISEITETQNFTEASEALSTTHYPLVIIDESMLEDNHLEETMRWIENNRQTTVICQIFKNDEANIERVKQAGAGGYFYRGTELEVLKNEVKNLLKGELVNGTGIHLF